jgi:hypothetical protein
MSSSTAAPGLRGYQARGYAAERRAVQALRDENRLSGWASQQDVVAFHHRFAPPLFVPYGRPAPNLVTGSGRSRYYPRRHRVVLLAADRNVVVYSHQLGHALAHAADHRLPANRHDRDWADCFLTVLGAIDGHAAGVIAAEYTRAGLTVDGHTARTRRGRTPSPDVTTGDTGVEDLLAAISANATATARLEAAKQALIGEARAAGLTLQAIADAYGTNKVTVMRWANRASPR